MNPVTQTPLNGSAGNPLQGLHDIHLPTNPGFWPLPPGWWIVLGVIILFCIVITIWWWRKHCWKQYILTQVEAEINKPDTNLSQQLAGLSAIVRRVALRRYPREQVATLHGQNWLDFLQKNSKSRHFDRNILQPLADSIYQLKPGTALLTKEDPLVQFIIKWIQENLS